MDDLKFIIESSFTYFTTVEGLIQWFNVVKPSLDWIHDSFNHNLTLF